MLRNEFAIENISELSRRGLPIINDSMRPFEGRVGFELIDVAGPHKGRRTLRAFRNTLTTAHQGLVASWLAGLAPAAPGWMALGTGAVATYAETNRDTSIALRSTGAGVQHAQEFVCDGTNRTVYDVLAYLKRIGTSSGLIWCEIQTNSAGLPSGTPVSNGISDTLAINGLGTSFAWTTFTFPSAPALTASATYHLVIKSSGYTYSAAVTEVDIGTDQSAPGYASGDFETYDGVTWSAYGTASDMCFRIVNTPTVAMTTLLAESTRKAITSGVLQSSNIARLLTNFTAAQAVGHHGEAGLLNAASVGTLSAIVPCDIEKSALQALNIYWTITVN